jgi:hypothetical protein
MMRKWLAALWVAGMLGFVGGGFFLAREATATGALDKAKVALAEQGIAKPRTSLAKGSLVIEGGAADTAAHLAAVVAVRQHYPKRHIVDKIRVANTKPLPGSPVATIDPIVDVPTSLELGS